MAIRGVFTDAYRARYAAIADIGVGSLTAIKLAYFKIGEKGHNEGVPPMPVVPLASRTNIVALYDQEVYFDVAHPAPAMHNSFRRVDILDGQMNAVGNVLTVSCVLPSLVGNHDGYFGGVVRYPVYYEMGIFDAENVMMVYCTFDGVTKVDGMTLQHNVYVTF